MVGPRGLAEVSSQSPHEGASLPRLKGRLPFRLATTSYIIPAAILPNIRFLGDYVDEIELVLFESQHEHNLPTLAEIGELKHLAGNLGLTYNVHLPGDLFFGDPAPAWRRQFCDTALRFYERTLPLDPTSYTLHLDSRRADGQVETNQAAWQHRVRESLEAMRRQGLDLRRVVVENLEYPLGRILHLAKTYEMGICLDIGHLFRYRYNVADQIQAFLGKSSMIHLHGVEDGQDHLGLHHIPRQEWVLICQALRRYKGTVSLEVFSLDDLGSSLNRIKELVEDEKDNES